VADIVTGVPCVAGVVRGSCGVPCVVGGGDAAGGIVTEGEAGSVDTMVVCICPLDVVDAKVRVPESSLVVNSPVVCGPVASVVIGCIVVGADGGLGSVFMVGVGMCVEVGISISSGTRVSSRVWVVPVV
jgi:hypothetical protein